MEPQPEPIVPTETEAGAVQVPQESPSSAVRLLVQEMVAAGEWPDPKLLEWIIAAGQEAVPPLIEVLEIRPKGWPEEAPLQFAAELLCAMGATEALPALREVIRFYQDDTGIYIADEMYRIGDPGMELLLELIGDASLDSDHRLAITESALFAAGSDPKKRAQVAEVLRTWFTSLASELAAQRETGSEPQPSKQDIAVDAASEVESEVRDLGQDEDEEQDEAQIEEILDIEVPTEEDEKLPDEWDDEGDDYSLSSTLGHLAYDLAALGDELARPMIEEAFSKKLIDTSVINPDDVEEIYARGGVEFPVSAESWLDDYRRLYDDEKNRQRCLSELPEYTFPARSSYPSFDLTQPAAPPERLPPIEPIRNVAPRIGRNDPCWCGSGKKYKKCHLGKDAPA